MLNHVKIVAFNKFMSMLHIHRLKAAGCRFQVAGCMLCVHRFGRQRGRSGGRRGGCEQRWTKVSCEKCNIIVDQFCFLSPEK